MNKKTTKKARGSRLEVREGLAPEYRLDYKQARPNRFARRVPRDAVIVILDADVAEVFHDSKQVNKFLRAAITAVEKPGKRRAV
jgi:hypothetical protein